MKVFKTFYVLFARLIITSSTKLRSNMGSPTIFQYQMYPNHNHQHQHPQQQYPVPSRNGKKRCVLTENGIKCKFRRDDQSDYYLKAEDGSSDSSTTNNDGSGSSDLIPLVGVVTLKGLKGFAGLFPIALTLPLLPFILPLPFIAIAGIVGLLAPVNVGRSLLLDSVEDSEDLIRNITFSNFENALNAEECMERIVCKIVSKMGKEYSRNVISLLEKLTNSLPQEGYYFEKIKKGFNFAINESNKISTDVSNTTKFGSKCMKFVCNLK